MNYLVIQQSGIFRYQGGHYELRPITYPEVDISQILAINDSLARAICAENPIIPITFAVDKIPGFPRPLEGPPQDLPPGTRLMLVRGGGIGDVIMLTPALLALKRLCGERLRINLSTFANRHPLFEDLPFVDGLLPHPLRLSDFMAAADYFVEFNDIRQLFNHLNMTDFHLDCLHIDPASIPAAEKAPIISPRMTQAPDVRAAVEQTGPRGALKFLCALEASDAIRTLPGAIVGLLAEAYPQIQFLVATGDAPVQPNIHRLDTSRDLQAFATAIDACDGLVCADSSAYHIAAALAKPALVFFGPITSSLRTTYYPRVVPLDARYEGETCSAPCGISAIGETPPVIPIGINQVRDLQAGTPIVTRSGRTFSFAMRQGCPEAQACASAYSPCLAAIPRERILAGFAECLSLLGNPVR